MSWIDGLHGLFQSAKCVKFVVYQARVIEFSGLEGNVSSAKFSIADFKLNTKMVQTASEMAKAFDDYQFAGTKTDQVRQIGNAVAVRTAEALCGAMLDAKEAKP